MWEGVWVSLSLWVCMCVCMCVWCVCVCVCMCTQAHVRVCVCMQECVCVRACRSVCVCVSLCAWAYMRVKMCVCIMHWQCLLYAAYLAWTASMYNVHTHTHTHTHTHDMGSSSKSSIATSTKYNHHFKISYPDHKYIWNKSYKCGIGTSTVVVILLVLGVWLQVQLNEHLESDLKMVLQDHYNLHVLSLSSPIVRADGLAQ